MATLLNFSPSRTGASFVLLNPRPVCLDGRNVGFCVRHSLLGEGGGSPRRNCARAVSSTVRAPSNRTLARNAPQRASSPNTAAGVAPPACTSSACTSSAADPTSIWSTTSNTGSKVRRSKVCQSPELLMLGNAEADILGPRHCVSTVLPQAECPQPSTPMVGSIRLFWWVGRQMGSVLNPGFFPPHPHRSGCTVVRRLEEVSPRSGSHREDRLLSASHRRDATFLAGK